METQTQTAIEVLNSLVIINNDRIAGYETASSETDEQDLKTMFAQFITTSKKNKKELVVEVTKLGGEIAEGTLLSGKFYRAWMEVKVALSSKDRKAILDSCEFGEDVAVDAYTEALADNMDDITAEQQTMLIDQQLLIKADHDKVKALRDALL